MAVQDAAEDSAYALNQKYLLSSKNNTAKMPQNVIKIRMVGQTFPYPTLMTAGRPVLSKMIKFWLGKPWVWNLGFVVVGWRRRQSVM